MEISTLLVLVNLAGRGSIWIAPEDDARSPFVMAVSPQALGEEPEDSPDLRQPGRWSYERLVPSRLVDRPLTLPKGNVELQVAAGIHCDASWPGLYLGVPGGIFFGLTDWADVQLPLFVRIRKPGLLENRLAVGLGVATLGHDTGLGWIVGPAAEITVRFRLADGFLIEPVVRATGHFFVERQRGTYVATIDSGLTLIWSIGTRVAIWLSPSFEMRHESFPWTAAPRQTFFGFAPVREDRPLVLANVTPWFDLTLNPGIWFSNFSGRWGVQRWTVGLGGRLRADLF